MNAVRRRPRSKEKIRQIAEDVLARAGISRSPVPVEQVASFLGATVKYSPFEGELAGVLVRGEGRVVIGVNSSHHSNRQRFTIAHECGHLLLHEGGTYVDKSFRVNLRDDVSSLAIDPEEIEANRFAAELLMPYKLLIDDLHHEIDLESEATIGALARKYGVSLQAMTHRIANVVEGRIK
jgi:Zn-dependent peptidase ImmA (M78 family)